MNDSTLRIGIDVGGTNTDAAAMHGERVLATAKCPTTSDVTEGIVAAIAAVLSKGALDANDVGAVMIGTTHFLNAVVQRQGLTRSGAIRLCGGATASVPPMVDWPGDLRAVVEGYTAMLPGGSEFDGSPISQFEPDAVRRACREIKERGVTSVAVTGVFALVDSDQERQARDVIEDEIPGVSVSLSHEIGRVGLLERENATILNACLQDIGRESIRAFRAALRRLGLSCALFISQNDGTLMTAEHAERYPVLTFASGPTNSMRGAGFLSGLRDALVVDIGGTTTDVGAPAKGLPRQSAVEVRVGGVRTNFRMPDVYSIGLGGGSRVHGAPDSATLGPDSVGFNLTTQSLVFGGATLTATDIAVAAGHVSIGDSAHVAALDPRLVAKVQAVIQEKLSEAVDRMKVAAGDVPVILVGGGSILANDNIKGASQVHVPSHFGAANAVGAAIAQVSGEVDKVVSLERTTREAAIKALRDEAVENAVNAGAISDTVEIAEVDEIALAYVPGEAVRMRAKAIGDLKL